MRIGVLALHHGRSSTKHIVLRAESTFSLLLKIYFYHLPNQDVESTWDRKTLLFQPHHHHTPRYGRQGSYLISGFFSPRRLVIVELIRTDLSADYSSQGHTVPEGSTSQPLNPDPEDANSLFNHVLLPKFLSIGIP